MVDFSPIIEFLTSTRLPILQYFFIYEPSLISEFVPANTLFDISESLKNINEKLVRRHPHVFDKKNVIQDNIISSWELQKHKEKNRSSRLDGVPISLPGIIRAQRIQEKASHAGLDFQKEEEIWEKISEEMEELKNAQKKNNKHEISEELGDTIFSLINLARFLGISAEDALRKSNNKFINRFKMIENELNEEGKNIEDSSFNELEDMWNNIKKNNNS